MSRCLRRSLAGLVAANALNRFAIVARWGSAGALFVGRARGWRRHLSKGSSSRLAHQSYCAAHVEHMRPTASHQKCQHDYHEQSDHPGQSGHHLDERKKRVSARELRPSKWLSGRSMLSANARREVYRAEVVEWAAAGPLSH